MNPSIMMNDYDVKTLVECFTWLGADDIMSDLLAMMREYSDVISDIQNGFARRERSASENAEEVLAELREMELLDPAVQSSRLFMIQNLSQILEAASNIAEAYRAARR